jgi:hypothetical protein
MQRCPECKEYAELDGFGIPVIRHAKTCTMGVLEHIWGEPLTPTERRIINKVRAMGDLAAMRKWISFLLQVHDALAAQAESASRERDRLKAEIDMIRLGT